MPDAKHLANAFDKFSEARLQNSTLEQIWQKSFGDEYAAAARPNAFYPQSVLDRIVGHSADVPRQGPKAQMLDVGCGHGLTSIYLARSMGLSLFSIDVSPASIQAAQDHTKQQVLSSSIEAKFWVADATSIDLLDASCAVVTCLDVMLYFPDKLAVVQEIRRVLQPGGVLAFTTWEQAGYNARLGTSQVQDHRKLLEEAGLMIELYTEVEYARETQDRVFQRILEHQDALKAEIGEEVTQMFVKMAHSGRAESAHRKYVFGIARRRESPAER